MNTAQTLSALTDCGKLELLATSIFRLTFNDAKSVIYSGVNAAGEPNVGGFIRIPKSDLTTDAEVTRLGREVSEEIEEIYCK